MYIKGSISVGMYTMGSMGMHHGSNGCWGCDPWDQWVCTMGSMGAGMCSMGSIGVHQGINGCWDVHHGINECTSRDQ